jgi:hypothetical protein
MTLLAMFIGGLLGSAHCVGMCGGFALAIGALRPKFPAALMPQLAYSAGRLITYGFLGALGGLAGAYLSSAAGALAGAQRAVALVAGVVMLYMGASSLGLIRFERIDRGAAVLFQPLLGHFIRGKAGAGPLLAGLFTGFLPCGLVYAFLALAVASADPVTGWLGMVSFGLGTVPAMVLIGCGSTLLTQRLRVRAVRLGACFVMLLGAVTIWRGLPAAAGHCHTPSNQATCCSEPEPPAP